jgi:hypothetical protein
MSRDDWYRCTDWDPKTREEFFRRLSRSRRSKGQYLRIQASYLQQTDKRLVPAAIELLDLMFTQFPDPLETAQGHLQKADCLELVGDCEGAIGEFRRALEAERTFPKAGTQAWLDFGWFVAERRYDALYPEALAVLVEFLPLRRGILFPVDVFRLHGIRALIAAEQGRTVEAVEEARLAMEAAEKPTSGFRYHPNVGLVRDRDSEITRRIASLATSG